MNRNHHYLSRKTRRKFECNLFDWIWVVKEWMQLKADLWAERKNRTEQNAVMRSIEFRSCFLCLWVQNSLRARCFPLAHWSRTRTRSHVLRWTRVQANNHKRSVHALCSYFAVLHSYSTFLIFTLTPGTTRDYLFQSSLSAFLRTEKKSTKTSVTYCWLKQNICSSKKRIEQEQVLHFIGQAIVIVNSSPEQLLLSFTSLSQVTPLLSIILSRSLSRQLLSLTHLFDYSDLPVIVSKFEKTKCHHHNKGQQTSAKVLKTEDWKWDNFPTSWKNL